MFGTDQAKVAMGEVHKGIFGTHQSAPKMKWLLRRAGFYWPSMISDCFKYYMGQKNVNGLGICNWYLRHCYILSLNHGHSEIGGWILLDKLILHLQRGIASCWLLQIILPSGPKRFL